MFAQEIWLERFEATASPGAVEALQQLQELSLQLDGKIPASHQGQNLGGFIPRRATDQGQHRHRTFESSLESPRLGLGKVT